jgi:hypothetical protein
MKRTILLAAATFLISAVGAQADTNFYRDATGHARPNYIARADAARCGQLVGPDYNGVPTSRATKHCMARFGWQFRYTRRDYTSSNTWINRHGLTCQSTGFARICSNF